ncbi:PEP-CTERM sorting domain-containing protein [Poriferisphaera sp. WC338]|uniref:PEP-CTERM sorting domain-containing protein n=1 Tax=Poriferisphaera sp. WC338 TaxID=3425129 RepID=UPI003D81B399
MSRMLVMLAVVCSGATYASANYFTLDQLNNNAGASVETMDGKHVYMNFNVVEVTGDISSDLSEYTVAEGYNKFSLLLGTNTTSMGTMIIEFDVTMQDGVSEEINASILEMSSKIYTGSMKMMVVTEIIDDTDQIIKEDNGSDAINVLEHSPDNQQYSDRQQWGEGKDTVHVRMIIQTLPYNGPDFSVGPHTPEPGTLALLGLGSLAIVCRRR